MRSFGFLVLACLAVIVIVASGLPYIESNRWFVRMADFPRLQMLVLTLALVPLLALCLPRRPVAASILLLGIVSAGVGHALTLWPYRPNGEDFVTSCPAQDRISVLIANVLMPNRDAAPLLDIVAGTKPDLFLAMETDEWWDRALAPLSEAMPYRIQETGADYYGIHLFSRLPLDEPEIRQFGGSGTPAVVTGLRLESGETVGFYGLHPRPPHPSRSAVPRDAELYSAALDLKGAGRPAIVAGDLNATPWETTTTRMRRIAGLIDPRRGYGYLPTYSAKSWWRAWPLDQIFHQAGFATLSLQRLPAFGSDHYPYLARLCRLAGGAGEAPPALRDGDIEAAKRAIAKANGGDR